MQITAQMVGQLRDQTGAGMMECKKALTESDGDIEKARDILRAKGQASAEKRAGRAAADGIVAISVHPTAISLIELNSETDFVARNDEFKALAHEIAGVAAAHPHGDAAELLNAEVGGVTVRSKVDEALAKMRENIVLRRTARIELTGNNLVGSYIHKVDNKTGVLVELTGDPNSESLQELAKNIAMHIAAQKPKFLNRSDVSADAVERERAVLAEKTRNEGKPEAAIEKIVEGRLGKFFEQFCLLEQPYVRDGSKTIGALAKEAGSEVIQFALFVVGQD
ncbi:MAG: translation elongation factor Ts [Chthonomonadales bacterium]